MSGADDVQAKVDLMAKVFLGRLPVRFAKMDETLALCRAAPADEANWTELHRQLHSLAGAAGTFGCDGLGERARALEYRIKALAGQVRSAADLDAVADTLNELKVSQ